MAEIDKNLRAGKDLGTSPGRKISISFHLYDRSFRLWDREVTDRASLAPPLTFRST